MTYTNDRGIYSLIYAAMVISMAFAFLASPVFAAEDTSPFINDIKVAGLARINNEMVFERISQRIGERVSSEGITADIHKLFQTGYFEDVRVEMEPLEGGLRLIYILKEKPTIRRVEIYGNKIIDDDVIEDEITISPGAVTDMALIEENVFNIVKLYEKRRHPRISVVPVLRQVSEGHILLTFYISEGERVKVDDIIFVGNKDVSSYRLQKAMETTEWWMFAGITGAGRYQQDVLEEDIIALGEYLQNNGYLKSEVSEPEITYKKNNKWMDITIHIKEGLQYTVGMLEFEGNKQFSDEKLRKVVTLTPGEVFSKKVLKSDVAMLTETITMEGYALASVFPKMRTNDETLQADMIFKINEGDIYDLGRIEIKGNIKTHDKVIRREIRLSEGEQYDGKKLKRSFQMINNLNFFDEIDLDPQPDIESRLMRMSVKVGEKSTGSFNVGAGYSSVEQFVGMVDVTFGNFMGKGQMVRVSSQFSSDSTTYSLEFKEPWLFDKPVEFTSKLFKSKKEYDEYTKLSDGVSLGLSRRFKEYWKIGASYTYRIDNIQDVAEDASQDVLDLPEESTLSGISPYISRDSRDNYLNPHSGSKNVLAFTYAGIGGDNYFAKATLDTSWILPVTKHTEFSMRGRYGYASGLYGHDLPLYERYYVGGPYSVRGMRRIGPHDEDGDYLGGRQRLIFNFDYTFPLISDAGLKGDIFYDTGTAFDDSKGLKDMRETAGVGFKWVTPIGPLMFYYAKNMDQQEGEAEHRWEFAIGSLF